MNFFAPHSQISKSLTLLLFCALNLGAGEVAGVIEQTDILSWTGSGDTDPRALEVLEDGRLVYFEDDGGAGSAEDALVLVDPTLTGTSRFSVLADEDTLEDLSPQKVYGAKVSDLFRDDNGDLYALVTGVWNSKNIEDNYVVRFPWDGTDLGTPERVLDIYDNGLDSSSRAFHRLTVSGDTLFVLYDNLDSSDDLTDVAGSNGVYSFELTGTIPGGTADMTLLASYKDISDALDTPVTTGQAFGLWQIRADSSGDLFGFVYEHGGGSTGDLVTIDGVSGTVSVFMSQAQAESETGINNIFTDETNLAVDPSNDHLFVMETGTGAEEREILFEFDTNGVFVAQHAHHYQIEDAVPNINESLSTVASNALTVGTDGTAYLFFTLDDDVALVSVDPNTACNHGIVYHWPTGGTTPPQADLASPYGPRQLVSGNYRYDFHRGLDIDMTIGTPVYAVADGVVEKAGTHSGFSEPVVAIRHGDCAPYVYSYYLHLDSVSESLIIGETVSRGTEIGESGESASGYDHLHFEMRVGGIYQSHCRNPLEFLPYTDTTPAAPTLIGANTSATGDLFFFEYSTPDTQFDLNGLSFDWGADTDSWNWPDANKANGPDNPEHMDRPVVDFASGMWGVAFAEHTNSGDSQADYSFAVSGLDASGSSGNMAVADIWGSTASASLSLANLPDLTLTPATRETTASPGDTVNLTYTVTNTSASSVTVTLEAISSANNTISLSSSSLSLSAGSSDTVTVTVSLNSSHPDEVGDGIILTADTGSGLKLTALGNIQ
ncbi:MAG: M23 family metallopeptidase [Acidobacteriota bacterium]|nr:M23 family metallopeptidase [Acidobacteriota bacterium]